MLYGHGYKLRAHYRAGHARRASYIRGYMTMGPGKHPKNTPEHKAKRRHIRKIAYTHYAGTSGSHGKKRRAAMKAVKDWNKIYKRYKRRGGRGLPLFSGVNPSGRLAAQRQMRGRKRRAFHARIAKLRHRKSTGQIGAAPVARAATITPLRMSRTAGGWSVNH